MMLSDPTHMPNYDVILDTLSDGDSGNLVHNWFSDMVEGNPHTSGGDITRDRSKLAFATGENDSTLTRLPRPAVPDARSRTARRRSRTRPSICYRYSGPPAARTRRRRSRPTAAALAWAEGDGIKVVNVPSFAGGCTTDGATPNAAAA